MAELIEYTEPFWRGLNMRKLGVDEAYISAKSYYNKTTFVYTLSDECYTCPFSKIKTLPPIADPSENDQNMEIFQANVAHAFKIKILDNDVGRYAFENQNSLCEMYPKDLNEFGVYNLTVSADGECDFITDKQGVNVNLSILSVIVLVGLLISLIKIVRWAWRTFRYDNVIVAVSATGQMEETVPTPTTNKKRMRSLDTFRGLAIVLMIFVNSGGGAYWWIEHATWNGLHLADIVFPSFLWIMGVCIPISIKSQLSRKTPRLQICGNIFWRSFKLFAIGLCLNSINGPNLENLRIMGVLQRFGIAYLACGVVHTIFGQKDLTMPQQIWKRLIFELILLKVELVLMLCLIGAYFGITFGLPVPDCPKGYLGPGGKYAFVSNPNCIGGAAGYIDVKILGNGHIYQYPTAKLVYDSTAFDPEGIFGCLLTIVQVLFGVLAGMIILVRNEWRFRVTRWIFWGLLLLLLGGLFCLFSIEDGFIPINKNLWSLSFVFVTSGVAFLVLSLLYFVIDVRNFWSGYPFEESGKNAIIMYVGHSLINRMLPWHWNIGAMNTHFMLLLESVWNTLLWVAIALYLNITSIGKHFHSNPTYKSIVKLYADNNQISSMYELEGTEFMDHFQRLYLRNNALSRLPEYLLTNALDSDVGRNIYLGGNKLQCDCNSAKVLKLWLLERNRDIPDYNEILCRNLPLRVMELQEIKLCQSPHDWTDYIYYLIATEVLLLLALITKVSYDYWVFKTAGYLPWPASKMPKLPCDWLCES